MPGRLAALCALLALAACSAAPPPPAPPPAAAPASAAAPAGARFFQVAGDDTFWVSHAPDLDRVIAGGARLEVLPSGEVRAAAWDAGLSALSDAIVGGLAVPDRLGGGFVFWSRAHVWRARTFTGEIQPLPLGVSGAAVRGARAGLSSILVITSAGVRELRPGAVRLTALRAPALVDMAALSATRAARLDVFGRLSATSDGGARWVDLSPEAGLATQRIVVGEADLSIYSTEGHSSLPLDGGIELLDTSHGATVEFDAPRALETAWKNTRGTRRDDVPWPLHDASALALAVTAGAPVGDGTAFGTIQNAVVRADLRTGEAVTVTMDWLPSGVTCQALGAGGEVLFACAWDAWQGYGGYVLRSAGGAPPVMEKAFSDDGAFFADDDGAIGFTGSCRAEPRLVDLNARTSDSGEPTVRPVLCVRRGPGEWAERHVDLTPGETLVAWAPRRDGTATAIVRPDVPLPPRVGAPRATEEAGVRVLRLYKEVPGWTLRRSWQEDRNGSSTLVDRRFHVRDDGSVDAWLGPADDDSARVARGVTYDPTGVPDAHPLPPDMVATLRGGAFALAMTGDGHLHESTDHGRTWQPAGVSPVPVVSAGGFACSSLGCDLGSVVRLGWGEAPGLAPRVSTEPPPSAPPVALPRLTCTPRGVPAPIEAPPAPPAGSTRHLVPTAWGASLEVVDEAPPIQIFPPSRHASPPAPGAPPAPRGSVPKPPRPVSPAIRTRTLSFHLPLAPSAPLRRLDATNATVDPQRGPIVVPLLAPSGDVDLLVESAAGDVLVAGGGLTSFSAPDGNRAHNYRAGAGFSGLSLPGRAGGRALLLTDARRGLAVEDHGSGPSTLPVFVGLTHGHAARTISLARRDDGALGVLVLDGAAPANAAIAPYDRLAAAVAPPALLAPWSTVVTADDPRCKKQREGEPAYRALVILDPATWLSLDPTALPGMTLGGSGLALVRWGTERVCLEGLDVPVGDPGHVRGGGSREWRLVVRWGDGKERGAVLRAADVRQELSCSVGPP